MIKTREPSPEMAAASKPSGFQGKRRSWRDEEFPIATDNNKQETKGEQSDNKQETKGEQSDNKQETKGEQSDNKNIETVNKRISKPITSQLTKGEQSDNKRVTKPSFFELIGLQKKVTLYVYDSCKLTRSAVSGPITLEAMSISLQSPKGSVKTTTNRLREKLVIKTIDQKEGRGGFTKYRLDDSIYQEILHYESVNNRITNGEQSDNKRISKPITEPITSSPSSSSSYVLEDFKTTTTETKNFDSSSGSALTAEWIEIDYSRLEFIQFGKSHLLQWYSRKYCDAKAAQESIWHYAYFLKYSTGKKPDSPIAYLMGVMAKEKYFSRPDGYVSPEEEAQQNRIMQQRREVEQRKEREQEFFELVFEEYFMNLSAKKIRELSPQITSPEGAKACIRNRYFEEHWLDIREAFQKGLSVQQFLFEPTELQDKVRIDITQEEIRRIADQQFGPRGVTSAGPGIV
jgi:hypothetical protein